MQIPGWKSFYTDEMNPQTYFKKKTCKVIWQHAQTLHETLSPKVLEQVVGLQNAWPQILSILTSCVKVILQTITKLIKIKFVLLLDTSYRCTFWPGPTPHMYELRVIWCGLFVRRGRARFSPLINPEYVRLFKILLVVKHEVHLLQFLICADLSELVIFIGWS